MSWPIGCPPADLVRCSSRSAGPCWPPAGLRDTTQDADSARRLTPEVQAAAADVALAHDLNASWLNAAAAPHAPVTLREADCSVLLDHPRLRVLGAPLQQVFLMKMFANRPVDLPDRP